MVDQASYAQDVSILVSLLKKYKVPWKDGSQHSLGRIENSLPYSDEFRYAVKDIEFEINKKIAGTNPGNIQQILIYFSNTCRLYPERFETEHDIIGREENEYQFQIDIFGFDNDAEEYYSCWHLDKSIRSSPPKYTHPLYHFQFGGSSFEDIDAGNSIVLGSPRLPHPPMDIILGIHFIINNFFSKKEKDYPWVGKILSDDEYIDLIIRAQRRFWDIYFEGLSRRSTHKDFKMRTLFPLYQE